MIWFCSYMKENILVAIDYGSQILARTSFDKRSYCRWFYRIYYS